MYANARHLALTVREDPDGRYFSVTRWRPLVAAKPGGDLREPLSSAVSGVQANPAMVPVPPGCRVKGT